MLATAGPKFVPYCLWSHKIEDEEHKNIQFHHPSEEKKNYFIKIEVEHAEQDLTFSLLWANLSAMRKQFQNPNLEKKKNKTKSATDEKIEIERNQT